jgi:hypothetical protein
MEPIPHGQVFLHGGCSSTRRERPPEAGQAWGWIRSRQANCEFAANNKVKDAYIMATSTILLIIVILLLLGAVPAWPHSRSWGYGPSGVLGVILIILLVLLLLGRI